MFYASAEKKDIEKEVKQLSRVKHPNITSLYGNTSFQQATYLIMEYAEGGSLHNFLHGKVKPAYTLSHAISWALQCAEVCQLQVESKKMTINIRILFPGCLSPAWHVAQAADTS